MAATPNQPPEVLQYNAKVKELQQLVVKRRKLTQQRHENEMVKAELALLEDGDVVYKFDEGDLAEEDPLEAEMCVEQRLDYINEELRKLDEAEPKVQAELKEIQKRIIALQQQAAKKAQPKQK